MGRGGTFGGRFRVRGVTTPGGEAIYDGAARRFLKAPPAWTPPDDNGAAGRLHLEFLTPLRMRTGGRYNLQPTFVDITHALLRRLHLLAALYGSQPENVEWMHPLLAQADAVHTESARFRVFEWGRTSGRQGRRIEMDGVVGSLTAAGPAAALVPYFRMGELVNVGNGTSMGLGRFRMRTEPAP